MEWHRIGISFKGDSITLIFDCSKQITKKLQRTSNPRIATDGLIFMGVQLDEDEDYFMGDIQTLFITDKPDSAYEVCNKFAPNCINPQTSSRRSESKTTSSKTSSSKKSSKSRSKKSQKRPSSDQASSQNDRYFVERTSLRNFGASSVTESGVLSQYSGESDGLGIGINGEDDYYDSMNSADENEMLNTRTNRTRPLTPDLVYNPEPGIHEIEPPYNPEPGIHDMEPPFNPEPGIHYPDIDHDSSAFETTTFSTVVNGVKIKSLPGPRGKIPLTF